MTSATRCTSAHTHACMYLYKQDKGIRLSALLPRYLFLASIRLINSLNLLQFFTLMSISLLHSSLAVQGFFVAVDGTCAACPEGTTCTRNGGSTSERLQLLPGYWRVSLNSAEIFECPYPKGCIGDNGTLAADLNYGNNDDLGSSSSGDDATGASSSSRKLRRQRRNGRRSRRMLNGNTRRQQQHHHRSEGGEDEGEGSVALSSSLSPASSSSSFLGERKSRLLGAVPGDAFGDAYCNVGYMGPLCGVCDTSSVPSYYFDVDAEE